MYLQCDFVFSQEIENEDAADHPDEKTVRDADNENPHYEGYGKLFGDHGHVAQELDKGEPFKEEKHPQYGKGNTTEPPVLAPKR
jgi:hypothetical protein